MSRDPRPAPHALSLRALLAAAAAGTLATAVLTQSGLAGSLIGGAVVPIVFTLVNETFIRLSDRAAALRARRDGDAEDGGVAVAEVEAAGAPTTVMPAPARRRRDAIAAAAVVCAAAVALTVGWAFGDATGGRDDVQADVISQLRAADAGIGRDTADASVADEAAGPEAPAPAPTPADAVTDGTGSTPAPSGDAPAPAPDAAGGGAGGGVLPVPDAGGSEGPTTTTPPADQASPPSTPSDPGGAPADGSSSAPSGEAPAPAATAPASTAPAPGAPAP